MHLEEVWILFPWLGCQEALLLLSVILVDLVSSAHLQKVRHCDTLQASYPYLYRWLCIHCILLLFGKQLNNALKMNWITKIQAKSQKYDCDFPQMPGYPSDLATLSHLHDVVGHLPSLLGNGDLAGPGGSHLSHLLCLLLFSGKKSANPIQMFRIFYSTVSCNYNHFHSLAMGNGTRGCCWRS